MTLRKPLLLFLAAGFGLAAAAAPEYRKLREATGDDRHLEGRVNFSPDALASSSGTYSNPPWSAESALSDEPIPAPAGLVNSSPRRGWMSPCFDAVDPEQPYLQLDFPYAEPVQFDTIALFYNFKKSPAYRPAYVIERRLAGNWSEIFRPKTLDEATRPLIRFSAPLAADALRIRFFEPSPQNAWTVERFWVYGSAAPSPRLGGGKIQFDAPSLALTEGEMVWQPGQKPRLRISFTPGAGVPAHPAKLTLRLTDYYRRPLFTEPLRVLPVDLGKPLQETVTLDALPPGPYYLTAEIGDGERVFARNRVLFGVAGAAPVPVRDNLPALDPPTVEIAGAVGQYDGLGQRKSRRTVDAVFKNGFNTMQLEYFWGDLEPLPGVYNFSDLDAMVDHVLEQGKFFNITLYFADDQTPEWLRSPEYIMRDQYGSPATGRNFWKMKFFSPPSVSSPLFRQHFAALWGKIAERCAGTGRMLRCDIRPPLLEVFFFDEYTNLYVNGGKTDFVWDYSRWAEQAFREYLRDCRKLTLEAVSRRYGRKLATWEELKLPLPLPKEQRAADRRPEWLDFLDFKLVHTQQQFYLDAIRAIRKHAPDMKFFASEACADASPPGREIGKLAEAGQLFAGNFSIEQGREYFQYDQYRHQPKPICFEWGEPTTSYLSYNGGLFSILPLLSHGSLRWVGAPALEEEAYANPVTWRSWNDLRALAPKLADISRFELIDDSEIALIGGFNHDNAHYENCRPVRRIRRPTQWDRQVVNNWGGLSGVLKAANYYNGLPPYYELTAQTPESKLRNVRLHIDGGHPDVPETVQRRALEFVRNGGKLVLWNTSFRRDGERATEAVRRELGITSGSAWTEEPVDAVMTLPGGRPFRAQLYRSGAGTTCRGEVIGRDAAGRPIAWRIPFGRGEVLFFNGLPVLDAADQWTPWMDDLLKWAGVRPFSQVRMSTKFPLPNLLTYAMREPESGRILLVMYNYTSEPMEAQVRYRGLPAAPDWNARIYHNSKAGTGIRSSRPGKELSEIDVRIEPLDLLLVELSAPETGGTR